MPQQISKTIGVMLFDEEVEAWQALEKYVLKKNLVTSSQLGAKKLSARVMLRAILKLAAEHVATDIGSEVATKLAPQPIMPMGRYRTLAQRKLKSVGKGRKPAKEPDPKPTHRIAWDRPWKSRSGDAG